MNNNINRITNQLTKKCLEKITLPEEDFINDSELNQLLNNRPTEVIRISQNAINTCIENKILPYDLFILTKTQLKKKYQNKIEELLTTTSNFTNQELLKTIFNNQKSIRKILNSQTFDLITIKEKNQISNFITINDLWLTPKEVIKDFFEKSKLNKNDCLDPCASDGRWLEQQGESIDILPMVDFVKQKDFLTLTKKDISSNVKYIVGNLPFSLLDEFVEKSLELVDECFFLVSGDTILKHFPNHIKHIYIFSGLEGNQKDNRSRCEFDVPFLIKSALWCCIVHITKEKQEPWIIESNISNQEKRDGFHIALGKNTFIKSNQEIENNKRITKINVKSLIDWKGGKTIKIDNEVIDLRNLTKNIFWLKL
ncbi:MAG: hypothetical protein ACRC4M_05080 [Mycoplasma sp.]